MTNKITSPNQSKNPINNLFLILSFPFSTKYNCAATYCPILSNDNSNCTANKLFLSEMFSLSSGSRAVKMQSPYNYSNITSLTSAGGLCVYISLLPSLMPPLNHPLLSNEKCFMTYVFKNAARLNPKSDAGLPDVTKSS